MKKLIIVLALGVITSGAFAQAEKKQTSKQTTVTKTTVTKSEQPATDGYYTRMENKTVIVKSNSREAVSEDMVKFDNGNYILSDGTYVYDGGTKKMRLEEGMRVDMKGNIIRGEMNTANPDKQ